MLQQAARQAARDSWKPLARHLAQATLPEARVLLVPLLLPVGCSVKAAAVVAVALAEMVGLGPLLVVAAVAVVEELAAWVDQALAVPHIVACVVAV